jgi:hypothetical protein
MNLNRRLERLGRQLGCAVHGEPLQCPACQPDEPVRPDLFAAMETLIDRIVARAEAAAACPVPQMSRASGVYDMSG